MGTSSSLVAPSEGTSERRPPKLHYKCRYFISDESCNRTAAYTRTLNIFRFPVSRACVDWSAPCLNYWPPRFTSDKVLTYANSKGHRDPDILKNEAEYRMIVFNKFDKRFNYDRRSYYGKYKFVQFDFDVRILAPANPVGRTGIVGRGHLCRYGPNHAADPIVTRWKKDVYGKKIYNERSRNPVLEFVGIMRRDTNKWAIPGGMRDSGEQYMTTLIREFSEEALSLNLTLNATRQVIPKDKFQEKLKQFFSKGYIIYKGYVDDPRNTDNAWMETIACNFHDENDDFVNTLKLEAGDDAKLVAWVEVSDSLDLFGSHAEFLSLTASARGAHWHS